MASDLPGSYSDSFQMARSLSTYLDCPKAVRSAVLQQYNKSPGLDTIREMRARHLKRKKRGTAPADLSENINAHRNDMAKANHRFLESLWATYPKARHDD